MLTLTDHPMAYLVLIEHQFRTKQSDVSIRVFILLRSPISYKTLSICRRTLKMLKCVPYCSIRHAVGPLRLEVILSPVDDAVKFQKAPITIMIHFIWTCSAMRPSYPSFFLVWETYTSFDYLVLLYSLSMLDSTQYQSPVYCVLTAASQLGSYTYGIRVC